MKFMREAKCGAEARLEREVKRTEKYRLKTDVWEGITNNFGRPII